MEEINQLISLLKLYLEQEIAGPSSWDKIVIYILPSISSIVLVLTAIAGYIKYKTTKNIELYEKILCEVYAPLYQYFVKQEMFSAIHDPKRDYNSSPILELINEKTVTSYNNKFSTSSETTVLFNLNRKEILRIRDNINTGLATQELLTLLNMYEVLIFMEEKYDKDCNEYLQATLIKLDVENAIRKEVFTGYQKYYDKLGLEQNTINQYWKLTSDNIEWNVLKSEELLNKTKEELRNANRR